MMMDMLMSLFNSGQALKAAPMAGAVAKASPIMNAADIKVQPMLTGMDPITLNKQAGEKVAAGFKADVAKDNQLGGLLSAMTAGGVNALGGGKEKQQAPEPQWVRGGSYFDNPGSNSISNMQLAGKLGGILNGRAN